MMREQADRELVEALGLVMTIKQSVIDIPHGGAYGAICIDKSKYSDREIQAVVRRYYYIHLIILLLILILLLI